MAGLLGFKLSDPLDFILAVDTMNCLAAAGCLAVLYWIILRVASSSPRTQPMAKCTIRAKLELSQLRHLDITRIRILPLRVER